MDHLAYVAGLCALGAGAGAISASLGLGGGIIMTPAFIEFLGMDAHTAKGTSLFIIIFIAALNAWRHTRVWPSRPWRLAAFIAAGSIVGGYFGGWITQFMPGRTVLWIIVGAMALLGVRTFFLKPREVRDEDVRGRGALAVVIGVLAGAASGMTGTGGGFLFVPLALVAAIVTNERVVGLSNMVMVATSAAGALAHFAGEQSYDGAGTVGMVCLGVAPFVFIGAQLGSPWGKWLNDRLTLPRRRLAMGGLLLVMALRLAWRAAFL